MKIGSHRQLYTNAGNYYIYLVLLHLSGVGRGAGLAARIRARHGRKAGGDGAGCGSHARAGGGRRMRAIKIFNDFLVPFVSELSKPKNIDYSLF